MVIPLCCTVAALAASADFRFVFRALRFLLSIVGLFLFFGPSWTIAADGPVAASPTSSIEQALAQITSEDEAVAMTKSGKRVMNVKTGTEAKACAFVSGDSVAIIGDLFAEMGSVRTRTEEWVSLTRDTQNV